VVGGGHGSTIAICQSPGDTKDSVVTAHRDGAAVEGGVKRANDNRSKPKFTRPKFRRISTVVTPPVIRHRSRRDDSLARLSGRHPWRSVIK
jgi:hypothetical protein